MGSTAGDGTTGTIDKDRGIELFRAFVSLPFVGSDPEIETIGTLDDVAANLEVVRYRLEQLEAEIEGMRSELALWKIRRQVMRDLVSELLGVTSKAVD